MHTSSADRILTTHVGSLPRPDDLAADLTAADTGKLDEAVRGAMGSRVKAAVAEAVARQAEAGIDIVSDGEMSKFGYATYVKERLTGFGAPGEPIALSEFADVPGFAPRVALELDAPGCDGPVTYTGHEDLATDIANLKAGLEQTPVTEAFMNSASPGIICDYLIDRHYGDEESYLAALADAMKVEYDTIAGAGLILQLDCPDLAMGRHLAATPLPIDAFRRRLELRVRTINHALRDLPRERVRIHMCWGNYESPHHHDVPLADILDLVLGIDAGAFLFEGANPQHQHEWTVFRDIELPDGVVIVPGVIDTLTNYVEHPRPSLSASSATPNSSARNASSPAPTAASRPSRTTSTCTRRSPGASSPPSPKAPTSPASVSPPRAPPPTPSTPADPPDHRTGPPPLRSQYIVRERRQERLVVGVHAVAERELLAALVGRQEEAADDAQLDVDDVVGQRLPFGNPAESPPMTPKRFSVSAGGTPMFSFSVSAAAGFLDIWFTPGMPVNSACTMSVRPVSLTPSSSSWLNAPARNGFSANLPKFFRSSDGDLAHGAP